MLPGFSYKSGVLHFASKSLLSFIKKQSTPFYLYDLKGMLNQVTDLKTQLGPSVDIHYAMKANSHPKILKAFAQQKIGVDTVSGGEIKRALSCGFKPDQIIFSGVGKSKAEIALALSKNIKQINVESPQELLRIGQMAAFKKKTAKVAFRLNPDVNANTHPYITTGFRENKFGMEFGLLPELKRILKQYPKHLHLVGLTIHIGSQLLELSAIQEAILKTKIIYKQLQAEGYPLRTFDIGGGVGIQYKPFEAPPSLEAYAKMITETLSDIKGQVLIEPGRLLVGPYGVLVTQIEYIKTTEVKNFAIVNTGMHHLLRPSLYQAYHEILPLKQKTGPQKPYDIVGPICESSDVLGRARVLPELEQEDYLAIAGAGAYGYVMSSNYNLHPPVKEHFI